MGTLVEKRAFRPMPYRSATIRMSPFITQPSPAMLESLRRAERDLHAVFSAAASGHVGHVDREWGFMTPNGLGPADDGLFGAYKRALNQVSGFFPPADVLAYFADHPFERDLPAGGGNGPSQRAELHGHENLHAFLATPPSGIMKVADRDIRDYQEAARAFILLASLAHAAANSASEPQPLPLWIEDPFRRLADRLEVPPALTGHFLTIENWTLGDRDLDRKGPKIDRLRLIHPVFGHDHERVYHGTPACMAFALRHVPGEILDLIANLRAAVQSAVVGGGDDRGLDRAVECLHRMTIALGRAQQQFQRISTDPGRSTHVSRFVFIRHMQPLHKGVLVRDADGTPRQQKGMSGLHFSIFYMLDVLIGRYALGATGELACMRSVVDYFPPPQRAFAAALGHLEAGATLAELTASIEPGHPFVSAFNRFIEAYAGDSGILAAHARKLMNYIHNGLQVSTAAEGTVGSEGEAPDVANNHMAAAQMFGAMNEAIEERRRLRRAPTMVRTAKTVLATSRAGGYATVAFDLKETGLRYEHGNIVRVLLPLEESKAAAWREAFGADGPPIRLQQLPKDDEQGWSWTQLWEALGWDPEGVSRSTWCQWVRSADVDDHQTGQVTRIRTPLDLVSSQDQTREMLRAPVPSLSDDVIGRTYPISPRVYSACGHESDRLVVMISEIRDGRHHHGFERMTDPSLEHAWIDFAPNTHFFVPPSDTNLLMVATGTGISPFVGLASELPDDLQALTVVHQSRSNDMFLTNIRTWLAITQRCRNALVFGFVSVPPEARREPMRYRIRGGRIEDLSILDPGDAEAYYFLNDEFMARIKETARPNERNLAYCCGGRHSAAVPLKQAVEKLGIGFEFVLECHDSPPAFSRAPQDVLIGDKIVDVAAARSTHVGGVDVIDRILDGRVSIDGQQTCPGTAGQSEHLLNATRLFLDLHPNPYNLMRCLGSPMDLEHEAFLDFIEREAAQGRVLDEAAHHYKIAALDHPHRVHLVRSAVELELGALQVHRQHDAHLLDTASVERIVSDLRSLLVLLPAHDPLREQVSRAVIDFE